MFEHFIKTIYDLCLQRPWYEYDSNYQIMFKVGMGVSPTVPDTLSDEGKQFVDSCLQHDPNTRATVSELLEHNFIKVFTIN